jgi:hypothetical protein
MANHDLGNDAVRGGDPHQGYECLFCGEGVEPDPVLGIPALLFIGRWNEGSKRERSQQFWCHADCFRSSASQKNQGVLYCLDADFYLD